MGLDQLLVNLNALIDGVNFKYKNKSSVTIKTFAYADDLLIVNNIEQINLSCNIIQNFCLILRMSLNANKSVLIIKNIKFNNPNYLLTHGSYIPIAQFNESFTYLKI